LTGLSPHMLKTLFFEAPLGLQGGAGFATVSIAEAEGEEQSVAGIVAGVEFGVPVSSVFSLRLGGLDSRHSYTVFRSFQRGGLRCKSLGKKGRSCSPH
ncbi:MAG: hypothetical protein OXK74_01680, partial [Gemmatimonadota bacterium]|nr:hypothetical protein [Gemmatimonadota bacterium]